ncbi:hypothetical protein [Winogradskyella thalassocola]|uniref:Uncharacterized protein n=1 Tax=Winogradskyella thalassocola TaxID=262004 RepID=A0A1G7VN33_9FLAO|nr:hypothetical protein [Winogradskyella thalassocola]SDG61107.1 hypothetical protein SAMN04489796_10171 [Winogradskyella thalassocola]
MKNSKIWLAKLLVVFQLCLFGQENDSNIEKTIDYSDLTEITNIDFSGYTIKEYSIAFDNALHMKNDSLNTINVMKGSVVLSVLAKQVNNEITSHTIDSNASETKDLLAKFRTQNYYVYQPEVSIIIKFFGYMCMGEYSHIYNIMTTNTKTLPIVIFLVLFLCVMMLHLFGKIKWRFKRITNKVIIISLIIFVIMSIGFKLTCDCNVGEYSFYGIEIN